MSFRSSNYPRIFGSIETEIVVRYLRDVYFKAKKVENNDFSPFLVIESSGRGVQETGTLNFHLSIKTEKSQKVGDFLKREKRKSLLKVKKLS